METSKPGFRDQVKKRLHMAWGFITHLWFRYRQDGCRESAAALTYVSLFALVPLMTLVYSVFSMIPAFQELGDQVNHLIFKYFIPESGTAIQSYLLEFSTQARKLSIAGIAILIVTSYLLLSNIEKTFNNIWDTPGNRRGLTSFLLYWGVLSFGPLLVGVGLAMNTYLVSMELIVDDPAAGGVPAFVLRVLPWLMTWIAFTMLFIAMPNCKVVTRYAVIGGLATTVVFQLVKAAFGSLVANSSFHSIYGAFAILPLFLLWIYLCWMIILSGAELVRSLETFSVAYRGQRMPNLTAVVLVCWLCWDRQQKGKSITDRDMMAAGIDQQHWLKLRQLLIKFRFLEVTRSNHYVFIRDLNKVTLWQLINLFGENFTKTVSTAVNRNLSQYPWAALLDETVKRSSEQARERFSISLADLFVKPLSAGGEDTSGSTVEAPSS
jgi:membrane protein